MKISKEEIVPKYKYAITDLTIEQLNHIRYAIGNYRDEGIGSELCIQIDKFKKGELIMAEQTKPVELKISSLKDLTTAGIAVALNLEEDAWSYAVPPIRGVYDLKCFLAKEPFHYWLEDEKNPNSLYITADIECRVVNNEEYEDAPAFTSVSTRVYRRRNISTMAGFLVKAGAQKYITNPIAPKTICELLEKVLHKEPVVKAELDWRGAYSMIDPKGGKDIWVNSHNHYEEFPLDPADNTKRLPYSSLTGKDGLLHEIKAQLRVVRFFSKSDELPKFNKGNMVVVATKAASEPSPIFVTGVQTAQVVNSVPNPVSVPQGDLELMLE